MNVQINAVVQTSRINNAKAMVQFDYRINNAEGDGAILTTALITPKAMVQF